MGQREAVSIPRNVRVHEDEWRQTGQPKAERIEKPSAEVNLDYDSASALHGLSKILNRSAWKQPESADVLRRPLRRPSKVLQINDRKAVDGKLVRPEQPSGMNAPDVDLCLDHVERSSPKSGPLAIMELGHPVRLLCGFEKRHRNVQRSGDGGNGISSRINREARL